MMIYSVLIAGSYYMKRHKNMLTKDGRYLLIQYLGDDNITIGIYEH